jgi:hypothetical protein
VEQLNSSLRFAAESLDSLLHHSAEGQNSPLYNAARSFSPQLICILCCIMQLGLMTDRCMMQQQDLMLHCISSGKI